MNGKEQNDNELAIRALENVREVLKGADLDPQPIEPVEDVRGYSATFGEDGPPVEAKALVFMDEWRFVFYISLLYPVPWKRLKEVVSFISLANYGLSVGNLEMDYGEHVVRYKSSVDFEGAELLPVLIKNALLAAMDGIEIYAEALMAVIDGELSAAEAIEEVDEIFIEKWE